MKRRIAGLTALALLAADLPAAADVLCLQDGRIFGNVNLVEGEDSVSVKFEHGTVTIPRSEVRECIIIEGTGLAPQTDEEKEMTAQGKVRFEGKWVSKKRRDQAIEKRLAEQQEEIDAMTARREWHNRHREETKNFVFESTMPMHVYENYKELFEKYYTEFAKTWKIRRPKDVDKLIVKFHVDHEKFMQVTGMGPGVGGFFRFIEPYELNIFYDRLNPDQTEEVIYHELGHYLQKLIDVDFKYPHWPGESLSEFYAASVWDPEAKKLEWGGLHDGRIVQIKSDIEKDEWVKLREQILGCQDRNFQDYSWGWSFVHYLMNHPKHAKNFKKFFLGLSGARDIDRRPQQFGAKALLKTVLGPDMLEAFMKYMKLKNDEELAEMEKEWYTHIQENLNVSTARGYVSAARIAQFTGRKVRAKRLYEDAIATGNANSRTYFLYGNLLHADKERKEAREQWRKAIDADPLVADYYIKLAGELIKDDEHWEEGERLLRLAFEIEPENYYLERNLEDMLRYAARKRLREKEAKEDEEKEEEAEGEDGAESS